MSIEASSHATVELHSAYLDRQLFEPEASRLEDHLEQCEDCHVRLEGLRKVVANLRRLESLDPPADLEHAVARRIALAGEPGSFLDRLESGLSIFSRQSSLLPMFGVVMALAVILYLFSVALERSQSGLLPVFFDDPPAAAAVAAAGERRELAGRVLVLRAATAPGEAHRAAAEVWVEEGVSPEAVSRRVDLGSPAGQRLAAEHPELEELAELGARAVIVLDGEVVEIR